MFDMNLDLSMGAIHFEAMGSMAGQVAPRRNPRRILTPTIHPKPRTADPGVTSVRMLAKRVL